jgi:hypothetical protein
MSGNIDLDQWLKERGIPRVWADSAIDTLRVEYPALVSALKQHSDVKAELELVLLVHRVHHGHFVLSAPKPRKS